MTDIVTRLRQEGENAMRQHLSLGMHELCEEAANEIERIRSCLEKPLPCEVMLAPATRFGIGVPLATVLIGIEQRRYWLPEHAHSLKFALPAALSPEQP